MGGVLYSLSLGIIDLCFARVGPGNKAYRSVTVNSLYYCFGMCGKRGVYGYGQHGVRADDPQIAMNSWKSGYWLISSGPAAL